MLDDMTTLLPLDQLSQLTLRTLKRYLDARPKVIRDLARLERWEASLTLSENSKRAAMDPGEAHRFAKRYGLSYVHGTRDRRCPACRSKETGSETGVRIFPHDVQSEV